MSFCGGSVLRCNTKDTATLLDDDKFHALEEIVEIIPRFSSDQAVDCIKGKFGPFRAHSVAKVPLWLALEMDRLQQCTIELPDWLHEEELKRMRDEERANPKVFGRVPERYLEIALAFLAQSRTLGNEQQRSRTVLLLRELVELRRNKIVEGLREFEVHPMEMNVTGMSAAEITCFRMRSLHALDTFAGLLSMRQVSAPAPVVDPSTAAGGEATMSGTGATQEDSSSGVPALPP
eukprot:NODE_6852_length_1632_cov_3.339535.p2 GENE.NODE_6852_length_1632_cov_3.339535~~NODE_6852_length_1632_cov_3.339535.p2  ORF type:complete len:234 (-),score=104.94 NODE_6852_length_1632_cov_3.339535:833-1534(-)